MIMKFKNMRISAKLIISLIAVVFCVVLLGITSFFQTRQLFLQAEKMYNHPLEVRGAIRNLDSNILSLRIGLRDLMLAETVEEKQHANQLMALSHDNALKQFDTLNNLYLGPIEDIENLYQAYFLWYTANEESKELVYQGQIDKVEEDISNHGVIGSYRHQMMEYVKTIDDFAKNKADELYVSFVDLQTTLNFQLVIIFSVILLGAILISYVLLRAIRIPLNEIIDVANRLRKGDMDARSNYDHKDEFGQVSLSFNLMASRLQHNMNLNSKITRLARVMLSQEETKSFFRLTLSSLARNSGAQMAAVYLLSKDNKTFEYYESIGLDGKAKKAFDVNSFEGEFGQSLLTHKYQIIKNIPKDTGYIFNTVGCSYIPKEILTIPVLAKNEIIAMISLGNTTEFKEQDIELIEGILDILSARVEGILANQTVKKFRDALEQQNNELDIQKTELSAQTAELIQQNAELEMQKKQLAEVSRLKTNFLSNMSHELRTPLNSVIALSGVLYRKLAEKIPQEEHSYLEVIERNGKNLLKLINDILDISRIEAGREDIDISKFNLKNCTFEIIQMLKPQAQQKGVELLYEISNNIFIASDEDKYRHIIQNIISNAIKFTDEGKVTVTTSIVGKEKIEIRISDTGIGISEEHLPHIFDEFRQADGSTSRRFGGAGLGLAIAKKYILLLGGNITVESKVNYGTTFTVTLPLVYDAKNSYVEDDEYRFSETEAVTGELLLDIKRNSNKTILLVEDSEPAIIQIKDLMEESGYKLLIAHNGKEAIDITKQIVPDAIILDLMMPEIDGFEVLKTLREEQRTKRLPVLILTAKHITKEELSFLKQNHIHQLIQKGAINRESLLKEVEAMMFSKKEEKSQPVRPPTELLNGKVKPLVLIAEDNIDNMTTVKALLIDEYSVIEAIDGLEAVRLTKKHKPDLVLMDISLPNIDGVQAFKIIRSTDDLKHIPIIALTASAMKHDRDRILAQGFDAFISKPIIEDDFFRIVRNSLYGG